MPSLKKILATESLSQSGNKYELENRILSVLRDSQKKELTAFDKGHGFEEQVASWLKKIFKDLSPVIKTQQLANGLSVKRPYEIDVCVQIKGKGIFGKQADVWVECKWKDNPSVKRTDIMKLVSSAQDVYRLSQKNHEQIYYNGLIMVSNQNFDIDALNYADKSAVLCVCFNGKKFEEQNELKEWLGNPSWLRQVQD